MPKLLYRWHGSSLGESSPNGAMAQKLGVLSTQVPSCAIYFVRWIEPELSNTQEEAIRTTRTH